MSLHNNTKVQLTFSKCKLKKTHTQVCSLGLYSSLCWKTGPFSTLIQEINFLIARVVRWRKLKTTKEFFARRKKYSCISVLTLPVSKTTYVVRQNYYIPLVNSNTEGLFTWKLDETTDICLNNTEVACF